MLKEIIAAIQSYIRAHRFIVKHRLWKWILVPGILYAVLFFWCICLFRESSNYAIDYLFTVTGLKSWMLTIQSGWLRALFIYQYVILYMVLLLFYFSLFKYIFLIVGAPVFAYLSEKTEAIIDGKDAPLDFLQLIKDIIRGVKLAFRNSLWQTVYTISILFLSFIPLFGWIAPLMALMTECYYFGFSMLDHSCERKNILPSQSIAFISKHKGLATGNGIVFYLMHFVLIIGWVLAPSYAIVAATLSLRETSIVKSE